MGRWFGAAAGVLPMVLAVGLALCVAVGGSAVAQTPEARPGQPGWTRTDRGCHVWNDTPQPGETASWSGGCQNGRASGAGTLVWRFDGKADRYDGGMRDGKEHGRGTFVAANGDRYDGAWSDGKRHGRGTYVWASGNRYEGEYRDGKWHGRGTFVWTNGDRYDGAWSDSKRHGRGTWIGANGDRFEGEYRDGFADGLGAAYFASNGATYNGVWRRGGFRDGDRRASLGVPLSGCP